MEESYDAAVTEYFQPYHHFVDKLLRFGFNYDRVADQVIACSKCLYCPAVHSYSSLRTSQNKQTNKYELCHGGTSGRSRHTRELTA